MGASGNWLLAQRLVTITLYKLLRLVFVTVQHVYWHFNGTAQKLREARLSHSYERSAQVLNVLLCHKFCYTEETTASDYLCTHNRFENPQYIIDNDNITLITVTEHDAVFCETKDKGMHLWRSEYDAIIRYAQIDYCRCLIIVPLTSFHRMAETVGDPKVELIFLYNTARCGSTLFTQIMERTGRCVTLSEPNSLYTISAKYRKYGESPELCQLARDVVRLECRPYPSMQPAPLAYLLKMNAGTCVGLPFFRKLFPGSRCLFMYRDMVTVAKSIYRISMIFPLLRLVYLLGKISAEFTKIIIDAAGVDGSDYRVRLDNDLTGGIVIAAVTTRCYLDERRNGLDVSAVRYEDLVARPLDMCRVILDYCHLPVSLAELAVTAFDVDSQRNSILAKSIVGRYSEPQLTPQIKTSLDKLLKKQGMPLIGEPGILEGTLTCHFNN